MSRATVEPVDCEFWDAIMLHHDFNCPEVSLTQTAPSDSGGTADVICFHPDRIAALINALTDLHLAWKRHNSDLYRDPSDTTRGDW